MQLGVTASRMRRLPGIMIIFLIAIASFFIFMNQMDFYPQNPVINGRLNLAGHQLDNATNLTLNGDWEFYWHQMLDFEDFSQGSRQPDFYIRVPDVWTRYQLHGEKLPAFGYATYRLVVSGADPDKALMIHLDSVSTAYNLYVNDQLMASNGQVSTSPEGFVPFNQPRAVSFHPPAENFTIIIQVSNFIYARGGIWYQINFGLETAIQNMQVRLVYKDAMLLGSLLIMTLYHLNLFILLHELMTALLLLLLDINMIARIIVYGDYLILRLIPDFPYKLLVQVNYLSVYWGPILLYFMVMNLFFKDSSKKWLSWTLLTYGCLASVATVLLPVRIFTAWLTLLEAVMAVIMSLTVAWIALAVRQKQKGALAMLIATATSMLLIFYDVLYQQNILASAYGELTSVGMVFLLFMLSALTANRFLKSYHERRQLQEKLLLSQQVEQRLKNQVSQFMKSRENQLNDQKVHQEVMIVADDEELRQSIYLSLNQQGYLVTDYHMIGDISDRLAHGKPVDVLLLDLRTLAKPGLEILKEIRQVFTPVELPVLLMVNRDNMDEAATGFWLGANDTIGMPFSSEELIARVRNLFQMQSWIEKTVSSELSFLQAQIKPHFIFNALSVIASRCLKSPEKARDLLLDLSDYLRESFDFEDKDGLTTLSRELKLVKAYLDIEQARFQDRLDVRFEIDKGIDCTLPILSIQPIVENAIRHGLMKLPEGGSIQVKVERKPDAIGISVSDNGIGMSQERIQLVLNASADIQGVGLRNIHRRLLALYGKGLLIKSEHGLGTRVSFEIPQHF